MSVFFYLENNRPNYTAYSLSILDESGIERHTKKLDHDFADNNSWGWTKFISRNDLFKRENGLIKNKTLIFSGKFKFINESKYLLAKAKSKESEVRDYLFNQRYFTDYEIQIQGKSIKVHKVVLAASSPMFASWIENRQYGLKFDNLKFEIVQEMINFIYDGKVKEMGKYAPSLLKIADEFKIERLKVFCEKFLDGKLCTLNAIEILKLSARCNAEVLKNECIDFI